MVVKGYSISQTADVLGDDMVTISQNQTDPEPRRDAVISFECPDMFEGIEWEGSRHPVRFEPRTMQTATIADPTAATVELEAAIQAVAGETELDEQPYPVVEVVNVTQDTQIGIEDLDVDYHADEVTIAESAVAADDEVKVYPILTEGSVKWGGRDGLNRDQGVVYEWPFPVFRWHDMDQIRAGREITMQGMASWGHNEKFELRLESPHQLVWEDADHPDAYVSSIEVDVAITL